MYFFFVLLKKLESQVDYYCLNSTGHFEICIKILVRFGKKRKEKSLIGPAPEIYA